MTNYLTREGLEKLKAELEHLEKAKRREVSERIRETASQGDLSENAGYHMAKEEQGFIEGRIKELKGIITGAKIIEKGKKDKVDVGSLVTIESEEGKEKFHIVGPEEADIMDGKISFKSPFGEAILNKKKGDKVKIKTADTEKEYKILSIE